MEVVESGKATGGDFPISSYISVSSCLFLMGSNSRSTSLGKERLPQSEQQSLKVN